MRPLPCPGSYAAVFSCVLAIVIFAFVNLSFVDRLSAQTPDDIHSKVIGMGTDVASFLLYHPDDMKRHFESPVGWYGAPFAVKRDLDAGRLVGFSTGSDGGYSFRLTTGELTDREQTFARCSATFRLDVRHGAVHLDNSNRLPCVDVPPPYKLSESSAFELENGRYAVTVTGINWSKEPGAVGANGLSTEKALQSYVIQFEAVEDFDDVKPPPCFPDMRGDEPSYFSVEFARRVREPFVPPIKKTERLPILLVDKPLKLRDTISMKLSKEQAVALGFSNGDEDKPREPTAEDPQERMRQFQERRALRPKAVYQWYVIANSIEGDELGQIGIVGRLGSRSWGRGIGYRASFGGIGVVKFSDVKLGTINTCHVERVESKSVDSDEKSESLRVKIGAAFEKYAFKKKIKAAEYNVGLVQSQPILRTTIETAIAHVEISPRRMRYYLVADELHRATLLLEDLETSNSSSDDQ